MNKVARAATGVVIITSISYAIISQANLKYSAVLLTLSQAVACYLLAIAIERRRPRFSLGFAVSIVAGWATSFIVSLLLEAVFFDKFFLSIQEQISYGNLLNNLAAWGVISFTYAGPVQAAGTFILFRLLNLHTPPQKSAFTQ